MRLLLFRAFLVINAFNIATENPIYKYRFKVYPVDTCPMNVSEFESAARRRNCTGDSRYLCAPDTYLSSLIEFCTDRNRQFYQNGNCVRLDGTGDLNHYNCVDRFTSGCPTEPYQDDKIFEYPMCLAINRESMCFISEKNCPERSKEDDEKKKGKPADYVSSYSYVIFIFMIALASVVFGSTLLIFRKKIKKRTGIKRMKNNYLQMDENYITNILLQDIPAEANDKDVQEDDKNDEMQINENALREYLSKGELTIQHIRCIIVGCARAGKTTLLSRLKNIPYEELKNIESTEIIDVHVNIFEVNKEEETIKCVDEMNKLSLFINPSNVIKNENKTEEEIVADENVQSKRESEEIVQEKKNSSEKSGTHGISSMERREIEIYKRVEDMREKKESLESYENNDSKVDAQDDNSPDKNSPTIEEDTFLQLNKNTTLAHHVDENHAISKIMDALKQLSNEKDLRPRITFLDFAGQSLYYAFHQIYLSKKTCYILVVDMTKDFKESPDTDKECASRFTSWTYEEYYKFWLKSIDSFSDTDAPVVVIGTHADKLTEDKCKNFKQQFYDLVDKHLDLRRHLNSTRHFTIGFQEYGSKDELKDIKKCIASLVRDPEKIKPVWAMFEHILENEKENKVISRKSLSNINETFSEEFRLTDSEITDMLLFFHRVGTLLYFDENQLRDTIILDIQWFAQAFKCIVCYDVGVQNNDPKVVKFLKTGEIDDDELKKIWGKKDALYLAKKEEILLYMEQLGLLAACKTEKNPFYYMPSMNKREFKDDGKHMKKSSILCFKFEEHGQLPVYLFDRIVIKCLKIPGWSIFQEKGINCIYDKVACFSYRHLIVVMCLCKFQIQVQLRALAEREIAQGLREEVQNLVEEKIKECEKYVFEIGYKCKNGIFNKEDEDSFVAVEKFYAENPMCQVCPFSETHMLGKEICWVQRREQTEKSDIIDFRKARAKEFSKPGNLNLARLSRIIIGPLTDVLRSVLANKISPSSLSTKVKEYLATFPKSKRLPISRQQETLISKEDYSEFDITLLYFLCRNVCAIPPHKNQWGNSPSPEDRSVSANIERIRLIRNKHGHTSDASVSDADFDMTYQEILNIVQQLEKYLNTSTDYQDAVREIKTSSMDQEESTKYVQTLLDTDKEVLIISDEMKFIERSVIPRKVKELMQSDILKWKEDDNAFVESHNFQTMLKKVRNQPFVTFVGVPGSGKTATARHIALILEAEGYEILPIKDIRNIETYCDSNSPQVCLIDDVLGVFGLDMNMFNMLTRYQDKIINPTMSKFKILMTCREAIYRKEDISQIFLSKEENVVHLHSEENALSCEDKNALLAKYDIDLKVLSSISNAQTSLMFPFLCKIFSRNKNMCEVYGPNFFISPVPVILQQFEAIKVRNKIQYASLVLLMVNQNALLEENLTNESTYKGKFYEKRICVFRHCKISPTTKGFNIIDALEEMEGTFVHKSGSRFMFLHESLFHITGYHFGCQFPEIILKYMDSDYIANYIKVNSKMDGEWGKDIPVDLEIDLCIRLRESNYPMFAERLFRDVCDGEMYNVFTNEALKHPLVIKAFINVMNRKSYTELYAIFLVDLQQMSKDRLKFQCQRCQKNQMVKLHLQLMDAHSGGIFRAISWAISFGHHHVLQFITDQILIHTGNITDLFEISYKKDGRRFSDVKQKEKQTSVDMIMEQCQLLCLGCCSGDLNTMQILLKYVDKDAINNTVIHAKHVYLNIKPLVVACTFGYLDIAKELVKAGADVSLRDALDSPLTAARKEGHLNIVEWLRKAGADATL